MKTPINLLMGITMALALHACLTNPDDSYDFDLDQLIAQLEITYQNACPSVTDAIEVPEPRTVDFDGTFVISDETVSVMSTCGLLVTLLRFTVYPPPNSDLFQPWLTMFNNSLRENRLAIAFFNRSDFYPIIISAYLSVIKVSEYSDGTIYGDSYEGPMCIQTLLASDMCMSALSENEKIQLMALALERTKYAVDFENKYNFNIMTAIMKSCIYEPFVKDIVPRLVEVPGGYVMREFAGDLNKNDPGTWEILDFNSYRDIMVKYAKQFINEKTLSSD